MAIKKSTKKTNIGMKASKVKPLNLKVSLSSLKRVNRKALVVVLLLVVGIGGFIVYKSRAATVLVIDNAVQHQKLAKTRASLGLPYMKASTCMNQVAATWSYKMATTVGPPDKDHLDPKYYVHFRHNWQKYGTELAACAPGATMFGENIGKIGPNCAPNGGCSEGIYNGFLASPDHKRNIINPAWNYVGVGSYRDDSGVLWITQNFGRCPGCNLSTWPVNWTLTGRTEVEGGGFGRVLSFEAKPNTQITWYHNVTNHGPDAASFDMHINNYRYAPNGTLMSSGLIMSTRLNLGPGVVWSKNPPDKAVIPATARVGEKFCRVTWFDQADGLLTGPKIAPTKAEREKGSCVTVK